MVRRPRLCRAQCELSRSTGFGKAFINAADGQWGRKMSDDLEDAVDRAVGAGIADCARVAIVGGSYGGFAVLSALTQYPGRYACGVDIFGPTDLQTLLQEIPAWPPGRRTPSSCPCDQRQAGVVDVAAHTNARTADLDLDRPAGRAHSRGDEGWRRCHRRHFRHDRDRQQRGLRRCRGTSPPRQNSCRPDRNDNPGTAMKDESGKVRTGIQEQSGGTDAAAGERVDGGRGARNWHWRGHPGALAQRGAGAACA
jgi:pimeloyl-ACP methyl ester carboxylesterase